MHQSSNTELNTQQDSWYVHVNGQAYGPYSAVQMHGFCTEGRVNEHSIISQSATQGYAPAVQFQSFLQWTGRLQQAQSSQHALQPNAQVLRPISRPQTGVLARQIDPKAPQYVTPNPTNPAMHAPSPEQHLAQQQPVQQPIQQNAAMTVFIVMAEIRSANGMTFLQALQAQGTAQRIGDSVWLLKSASSVEQLRNVLSQTLTGDDRLFLLDSFANKTAWFNIGTNMDARIRELWDMSQ